MLRRTATPADVRRVRTARCLLCVRPAPSSAVARLPAGLVSYRSDASALDCKAVCPQHRLDDRGGRIARGARKRTRERRLERREGLEAHNHRQSWAGGRQRERRERHQLSAGRRSNVNVGWCARDLPGLVGGVPVPREERARRGQVGRLEHRVGKRLRSPLDGLRRDRRRRGEMEGDGKRPSGAGGWRGREAAAERAQERRPRVVPLVLAVHKDVWEVAGVGAQPRVHGSARPVQSRHDRVDDGWRGGASLHGVPRRCRRRIEVRVKARAPPRRIRLHLAVGKRAFEAAEEARQRQLLLGGGGTLGGAHAVREARVEGRRGAVEVGAAARAEEAARQRVDVVQREVGEVDKVSGAEAGQRVVDDVGGLVAVLSACVRVPLELHGRRGR
mmetsp:Transcript_29474/g.86133  ORF Transcript_29474/g.86133 Transcript_29474/m.86133 type:complete len:388 (+) Transcript_29474:184-1347(+)